MKKHLLDLPDIFWQDVFLQEEHSCKIWLRKSKNEKSYCVLLNNLLSTNFLGKRAASHAQQQLSHAL